MDSEDEDFLLPGEADPRIERRRKRRGALPVHVDGCRRQAGPSGRFRRWVLAALLLHALPLLAMASLPRLPLLGVAAEGGSGWVRHHLVVTVGEPSLPPGPPAPSEPELPAPADEGETEPLPLPEAALPSGQARFQVQAVERVKPPPRPRAGGGCSGPLRGEGESLGSAGELEAPVWNPRPAYPSAARTAGWEGLVEVELEVGEDGRVVRSRILTSSGHEVLDRSALDALARWRFAPRSSSRIIRQEVVYQLEATKEGS